MNNKINKSKTISDLEDLNNHGVTDIIPPDSEYYTTDLRRGGDTNINDLPEIDIGGNNPLDEGNEDQIIYNPRVSTSSNAGGTIRQKDIINQNSNNGAVPGEPGHWGIDEDTG